MAAKLVTIGTGGISLVLAIAVLRPAQLGYYYSFLSIASWRLAMDGGMSYLIVRFVAHEWVHVLRDGGESDAAARITSLIRFVIPVYAALGVIFGVGVVLVGWYWFRDGPLAFEQWFEPLAALAVVVALNLYALAMRSLLEGVNDIVSSNRGTFISTFAGAATGWAVMLAGNPLYAVPAWFGVSSTASMLLWYPALRPLLRICRNTKHSSRISWRSEFWPLQWRLLLSTIGAMAMFQLFVPVAFKVLGPVSAGRIGIALQLHQAIDQLGTVWVQARIPTMAMLAARHQFFRLRKLVTSTTLNSVLTSLVLAVVTFVGYLLVRADLPRYGARLCNTPTIVMFLLTSVIFQIEHVQSAAVRCQKKEPFVLLSLAAGALTLGSTYLFARFWGETGIGIAFMSCICGVLVPGTLLISVRHSLHWDREQAGQSNG